MTFLEMSDGEKQEQIQCFKCRWKGKKSEMTFTYTNTPSKSFMFTESQEGYQYHCPKCSTVLMTSYV